MKSSVSRSSSGSRVREKSRPFIGKGAAVAILVAVSSPEGCDVYTADLLTASAGGALLTSSGSSSQSNVGTSVSTSAAGASSRNSTAGSFLTGGMGGAAATRTSSDASAGGTGGLNSGDDTSAHGGTEQTSGPFDSSAGMAGWGSLTGGAAGTTTRTDTANTPQKCWLDDMRGASATAPLRGCDAARTSNWSSFLPPSGSIVVKPPTIVPDPGVLFQRQPATLADIAELGDVQFAATVSGKVVVSDSRKYFGIRFPLYVGTPYSIRGSTLHFYYRTRYTAPASSLRVNLPTAATTDRQKVGGTCPQNCDDHFGYNLPNSQGNWSAWSLRLEVASNQGDLTRDWPQNDNVTFDISQVLAVEFGLSDSQPFEFSIGPIWLEWPTS